MRTTAVRKGDKWVINGSKCFITNGGYASFFTVYAKTDKEKGHRGISCFIVPKDDTVTVDKKEDKMGQRASNTATITFNDTEIPLDHLIGEENKGFKLAMMTLDRTRPGVAAMATGIARAAFEFATAYSKERVQFGVPIAMHQGIQFMIADMATKVHLSRLAAWHSAVLLDQGKRNTLESSHAKRFAADSAMEVTTDAVQVYGGYGFIKDYPVEKLMRDAKIMQLYEGTSQIQRLVIARETLLPRRIEEPRGRPSRHSSSNTHRGARRIEPLRPWDDRRGSESRGSPRRAGTSPCGLARESSRRYSMPRVADREHAPERAAGRRGRRSAAPARRPARPSASRSSCTAVRVRRTGTSRAAAARRRRRPSPRPPPRRPSSTRRRRGERGATPRAGRSGSPLCTRARRPRTVTAPVVTSATARARSVSIAQPLGAAGERRARVGVLLPHQRPLRAVRRQLAGRLPDDGDAARSAHLGAIDESQDALPRVVGRLAYCSWRRSKNECGAPG